MGEPTNVRITCDHPGCGATARLDTHGWQISTFGERCPEHHLELLPVPPRPRKVVVSAHAWTFDPHHGTQRCTACGEVSDRSPVMSISTARALLEWAEFHDSILSAEQIADVPAYQRKIYEAEFAEHEQGRTARGLLSPHWATKAAERRAAALAVLLADPVAQLRAAAKVLRSLGWRLLEVAANETTGFVRVIAECRDWSKREGVQVLLQRSTHDSHVIEERSRVNLIDGMFKAEWEIGAHLGRRRFPTVSEAARELLSYACGNGSAGALSLAETETRQASIAAGLKALA